MMTHQPRPSYSNSRYADDYYEDDRYEDDRYAPDRYDPQPRQSFRKKPSLLSQIPMDWLLSIGSLGIIFEAVHAASLISYLAVGAWVVLCSAVMIYTDKGAASITSNYRKFAKKYGRTGVLGIAFGVFAITSLFVLLAEPSQAFFLSGAEAKFVKVFADANTQAGVASSATGGASGQIASAIALVFGLIRIILLLAIIFGVVKAIQARDDQEQVKAQLMLPVIVVCGVIVVDLMTGLIFGA
jgi:hypothetical protein